MGAGGGDIAQEILFAQAGQVEIAHNYIRHNPGQKLLEFLDGGAITDEMRPTIKTEHFFMQTIEW